MTTYEQRQVLLRALSEGITLRDAVQFLRSRIAEKMPKMSREQINDVLAYCLTRNIVLNAVLGTVDLAAGRDP